MKLTEIACKNVKHDNPDSKSPKKISDGQGLALWVMPNNSKYWKFAYRFNGKQKNYSIGVYPEISLKQAREKRSDLRLILSEGKDPSLEKQKQKIIDQQDNDNTFEAIAREWYDERKSIWAPRYAVEVIKRLEEDLFPHIGNMPIKELDPPMILHVIRKIEKRGAVDLAKRQLQKCGEICRYAIITGRAVNDPTYKLSDALKPVKKSHFAALNPEELPEFLKDLDSNKARLYPTTINAMKLMLLTFVRTKELIEATWDEIDFERKMWTIPAERMKMGKEHLVPLSDQAIEILKEQKEIARDWTHLFPSPNKPRQSISNNTILVALKRMGYKGRMTGHGFRALAMSTIKQELNYRHEVIDRQLAHVPKSKIDRAYDRAKFLKERTQMMQEWADYVDQLC